MSVSRGHGDSLSGLGAGRGWLLRLGQDGDLLQLEAEVTNAAQQSVQLRLVGDLADEVGVAAAVPGGHPVEGACQSQMAA